MIAYADPTCVLEAVADPTADAHDLPPAADHSRPGVVVRRRFFGGFAATYRGVTGTGRTVAAALDAMARKLPAAR